MHVQIFDDSSLEIQNLDNWIYDYDHCFDEEEIGSQFWLQESILGLYVHNFGYSNVTWVCTFTILVTVK